MAITVLGPTVSVLQGQQSQHEEEGTIEERISRFQAEKHLATWKFIKLSHEKNSTGKSDEPLLGDAKLRLQLFNETGEDD
jgi:hypothetical protein